MPSIITKTGKIVKVTEYGSVQGNPIYMHAKKDSVLYYLMMSGKIGPGCKYVEDAVLRGMVSSGLSPQKTYSIMHMIKTGQIDLKHKRTR